MGGKCCTTLVQGSIPVVKEATQALASDYALDEAGPTLLPRACWCSELNRPDTKFAMHAPVTAYAAPEKDPYAFNGLSRQHSTNSLGSRSAVNPSDSGTQRSTGASDQENRRPGDTARSGCRSNRSNRSAGSGSRSGSRSGRKDPDSTPISRQSSGSVDYENMSESEKHREAKRIIKEFVTGMVKGKEIIVVSPTGAFMDCLLGLTRELAVLKVKPKWPKDAHARRIPLSTVDQILVGKDTGYSQMETPLDEFCVTLVLNSDDCVTFRMTCVESRDTLAACLTMFANESRGLASVSDGAP